MLLNEIFKVTKLSSKGQPIIFNRLCSSLAAIGFFKKNKILIFTKNSNSNKDGSFTNENISSNYYRIKKRWNEVNLFFKNVIK